MAQPIRNIVKEAHPEIAITKTYTLFIDGNNMLMRSFEDDKVNTSGVHYGGIFQFLLQIKLMLKKKSFDHIYCTFDSDSSGVLRYNIYKDYKLNRDKKYEEQKNLSEYGKRYEERLKKMQEYIYGKKKVRDKSDRELFLNENFARERDILIDYMNELCIRCIFKDNVEGDDIISYYCHNKPKNDYVVIWSADADLTQLISDTVCVYNPSDKCFLSKDNFQKVKGMPVENVVVKKIFCGDSSDNIKNIVGLSESRLSELMPEIHERPITIDEVIEKAKLMCEGRIKEKKKPLKWQENIVNGVCNGNYDGDFYKINTALIDLNNPLLTDEAEDEIKTLIDGGFDTDGRSFENLYKLMKEDDITELLDENRFSSFFNEFYPLATKEKNNWEKNKHKFE